jgi:hypothetical protein
MNTKVAKAVPKKPKVAKAVPKKPKVAKAVPKKPKVAKAVPKKPKVEKAVPKKPKVAKAVPKATKTVVKKPKKYNNINGGVGKFFAFRRTNGTNGTNNALASQVIKEEPLRKFFGIRTKITNPLAPTSVRKESLSSPFNFFGRITQAPTVINEEQQKDYLFSKSSSSSLRIPQKNIYTAHLSKIKVTVFQLIRLFDILTKNLIGDGLLMKNPYNEYILMKKNPLALDPLDPLIIDLTRKIIRKINKYNTLVLDPLVLDPLDPLILNLTRNIIRKINEYSKYTNDYLEMEKIPYFQITEEIPYFQITEEIPYFQITEETKSINTYNIIEDCIRLVLTHYKKISPDIHKIPCENYKKITKRAYDLYDLEYEC